MIRRILTALLLFSAPAYSHDWYESVCCSRGDCMEAPAGSYAYSPEAEAWVFRRGIGPNLKGAVLQKDLAVRQMDLRPIPPHARTGHFMMHLCFTPTTILCGYYDAGL